MELQHIYLAVERLNACATFLEQHLLSQSVPLTPRASGVENPGVDKEKQ